MAYRKSYCEDSSSSLIIGNGNVATVQNSEIPRKVKSDTRPTVRTFCVVCHVEPFKDVLFVLVADAHTVVGNGYFHYVLVCFVPLGNDIQRYVDVASVRRVLHGV